MIFCSLLSASIRSRTSPVKFALFPRTNLLGVERAVERCVQRYFRAQPVVHGVHPAVQRAEQRAEQQAKTRAEVSATNASTQSRSLKRWISALARSFAPSPLARSFAAGVRRVYMHDPSFEYIP